METVFSFMFLRGLVYTWVDWNSDETICLLRLFCRGIFLLV